MIYMDYEVPKRTRKPATRGYPSDPGPVQPRACCGPVPVYGYGAWPGLKPRTRTAPYAGPPYEWQTYGAVRVRGRTGAELVRVITPGPEPVQPLAPYVSLPNCAPQQYGYHSI